MTAVQYKHIPFTQNIIQALLEHSSTDNSLYIFPTEAGKRAAIREFQNHWAFQNIQFLTMEELKEYLFLSERPILKEEKRILAFYSSLSDSDKHFFKINNYFQSIELANNFFDLWEEFNEELLPEDFDVELLNDANSEFLNWQIKTYDRLNSVKRNYELYIESHDFADVIFLWKAQRLYLEAFVDFEYVHFVNQFYYTKLEQTIIQKFSENDKKVTLHYQLPAELVNKDTLAIKPFTIRDLGDGRTTKIDIIECKNEFTMLRGLLQQIHRQKIRHVVNFSTMQNPYARFLSPAHFNLGTTESLKNTSVFHFFQTLHNIFESLIFEPSHRTLLLPIQSILDALLISYFAAVFIKDDPTLRQSMLDYLYNLIKQEYKFIDLDGDFFLNRKKNDATTHLKQILDFIKSLLTLDSITAFVNKIDSKDGIQINAILTEQDKNTSNLRETFYRALADFQTLEKIDIINDWDSLFTNRRVAPQAQTAVGVLQLFLDYLKSRTIRYNTAPVDTPRVEFTDLQDTRNIFYKNVAVMNVVEKEIPHPRRTPFLFTERQRQLLGLKTYDDIKLREKYYLLRLVLTTPHVSLLTQKNIEQNIDVSSFVEEIRLYFPQEKIVFTKIDTQNYNAIFEFILNSQKDYHISNDKTTKVEFYTIPLDLPKDFPPKYINLSYYSLSNLLENAFTFYLKRIVRIDERSKKVNSDYSPMLIGNIVHDCLNLIWREILEQHILPPFKIDFMNISNEIIDKAVAKTLQTDRFYYSSPHNHAHIYFVEIVIPRIKTGIRDFFEYLDRIGLSNVPLEIYPEQDEVMMRDEYLPFIESQKIDFTINIGGRADLRMESPDKSHNYIFDYKTGGSNREQLILYELYYYLIQKDAEPEAVSSYFYHIMDATGKELREFNRRKAKEEVISEFDHNVREKINELWKTGFTLPDKKARLDDMADISRKDLFVTKYLPTRNRNGLL